MRNLFRIKKDIDDNTIKAYFSTEKRKAIKGRVIRDNRNLFEQEKEDYYKPVRVGNFWSDNYIEYESNCGRNKTL